MISEEDYLYLRYFEGDETTGIKWDAKCEQKLAEYIKNGWCLMMPLPGHPDEIHVTSDGILLMQEYNRGIINAI